MHFIRLQCIPRNRNTSTLFVERTHAFVPCQAGIQASTVTAGNGSQTVLPHNGHVEA